MVLLHVESLKKLLVRCTDDGTSEDDRSEAARTIHACFPPREDVETYGRIARMPDVSAETRSFIMSIIYVCGRKWPESSGPTAELRALMRERAIPIEMRTQAFLRLLLLDVDQAEAEAAVTMPVFVIVARAERLYPTIRRHGADAAYEEALLQLLFHEGQRRP